MQVIVIQLSGEYAPSPTHIPHIHIHVHTQVGQGLLAKKSSVGKGGGERVTGHKNYQKSLYIHL